MNDTSNLRRAFRNLHGGFQKKDALAALERMPRWAVEDASDFAVSVVDDGRVTIEYGSLPLVHTDRLHSILCRQDLIDTDTGAVEVGTVEIFAWIGDDDAVRFPMHTSMIGEVAAGLFESAMRAKRLIVTGSPEEPQNGPAAPLTIDQGVENVRSEAAAAKAVQCGYGSCDGSQHEAGVDPSEWLHEVSREFFDTDRTVVGIINAQANRTPVFEGYVEVDGHGDYTAAELRSMADYFVSYPLWLRMLADRVDELNATATAGEAPWSAR